MDDIFIDGEVDPVDLKFPGQDGFAQEVVRYDRRNHFNATIHAAAMELLPEVTDGEAGNGLLRIIHDLSPQSLPVGRRARVVPGRSRNWQPAIDLSNDILSGFGVSYKQGYLSAPGYVLSTWQTWESLLTIAVRLTYGPALSAAQKQFKLGVRSQPRGRSSNVNVFPDLTIELAAAETPVIVDAKYKSNAQKGDMRISESDVYEALAFARASSAKCIVLVYPALPTAAESQIGNVGLFEEISVGTTRILGVQVEVRNISKRGGLQNFATGLKAGLDTLLQ